MIRLSALQRFKAQIQTSSQSAHQADGSSPLNVVGETRLTFHRGDHAFRFEGLVVENLDVDILAGIPFMVSNDVTVRPARRQVTLGNDTTFTYGSNSKPLSSNVARRASLLHTPSTPTAVWPAEVIDFDMSDDAPTDPEYSDKPRLATPSARKCETSIVPSVTGQVRVPHLSNGPHTLKRYANLSSHRQLTGPRHQPAASLSTRHMPGQHHSPSIPMAYSWIQITHSPPPVTTLPTVSTKTDSHTTLIARSLKHL